MDATDMAVTLAALAVELVIIVAGTGYMLRKLFGLDRGTAYLSSFPGHLSFIMSISAAGIGDPRQITIIQVLRILMLTICVPIGALFLPGVEAAAAAAIPDIPLDRLLAVGALCVAAGFVFTRLRRDPVNLFQRERQLIGFLREFAGTACALSKFGTRTVPFVAMLAVFGEQRSNSLVAEAIQRAQLFTRTLQPQLIVLAMHC